MADEWRQQLHTWLQSHAGIIDVPTLVEFGCRRRNAYRLIEDGEFSIVMPGVLRSKHWPLGPDQLMMAACLRAEDAVVCGMTAARLWKFRGLPADDGEVHIVIPHARTLTLPGTVVQRSRVIDPVDVVQRADGVRMTSPPRTLFDCADVLGVQRTTSVLEQLINDEKASFVTHAATFARLGVPGRPGSKTMGRVIAARPGWRAALQSELEILVLREIERQGLPAPEVQYWFTLPSGDRLLSMTPENCAFVTVEK